MTWAKMLEEEYKKIAEQNSLNNLQNSSSGSNAPLGRVRDRIAEDVSFSSGITYERAKYVSENATEFSLLMNTIIVLNSVA